jgi:hypothetical protein
MLAQRLYSEIEAELSSLERLVTELEQAPDSQESWALRARGSILHDFYTGIEHIFVRLAEELNGGVPQGHQWQRELLVHMILDLDGVRPAVISGETATVLEDFLRFRHLFRNIYGFSLKAERLRALEEQLDGALASIRSDLHQFMAWLVPRD